MADTVGALLRQAIAALGGSSRPEARLEAEILLGEVTALPRERLIAWPELPVDAAAAGHFRTLVERRRRGEPVAHIRGRQAFWTLELAVSPDTLIPRPDTEPLVETALDLLPAHATLRVADAGTGTGAVAAALALERPRWTLIALEHSEGAVRLAAENLRRWAPANAWLVRCDWLSALAAASLDALVANPPYVRDDDPHLREGDLPFEPRAALTAGPDGLDALRHLSREGVSRLRPAGLIALEHGWDQGPAVRAILTADGYRDVATRQDLGGRDRVTLGFRARTGEEGLAEDEPG